MRIEQLEYVAVVARLGSFRRAADELHISQPALSGSVRSLERELGVDLLDRGRHGARMSDSGRELFPHILDLLDSFDRLRNAADEQHRSVRQVRLGTVNAATVPLLAPAIRQFRLTHQQTQVEVITAQQAEIRRGILEGSLDLGLVNYLDGDDLPPDLESTPLLRGRPVVVLRADSPPRRADGRDHRRPAGRAADRDAIGLPHAPLPAPPAAGQAAGHLLLHRRGRDGQADGGRGARHHRAARLQRASATRSNSTG